LGFGTSFRTYAIGTGSWKGEYQDDTNKKMDVRRAAPATA
jgi:hypothetical protein